MSSERALFFESNENAKAIKDELLQLQEDKNKWEAELKESLDYLASTPVGMDKRLIDDEGFPRDDCDLYAVRTARNRVVCRRNDLKRQQELMYEKLVELQGCTHDEAAQQMAADEEERRRGLEEAKARLAEMEEKKNAARLSPFLKVAGVELNSPAHEAGLRFGQLVLQYGDVTSAVIAAQGSKALVSATVEGVVLPIWVRDDDSAEPRKVLVVPHRWQGKGLLGCSLDPVAPKQ